MKLKHVTDSALLKDTKQLVLQERVCVTKILHHLREIESRRLFSDLKYGSLYEYAVKELGYSEAAANRRVQSARLLKELPELEEKFASGTINMTNAVMAAHLFREENIKDIDPKRKILKEIENKTKRDAEKSLASFFNKDVRENITFTVSEKTLEKFQNLKRLLGHSGMHNDEPLCFMIESATKAIEKSKAKFTDTPRTSPAESVYARTPSASMKRTVYVRDRGRCQKCGSNFKLQYDHIQAYAMGGKTQTSNLRLLCFSCNQRQEITMGFSSA